MKDFLLSLPPEFRAVPYVAAQIPDGTHDLSAGANCQRYAYAVLDNFGLSLPPLRSSELWDDAVATMRVTAFAPLDLLLFGPDGEAFGAHVGIYAGDGRVLHLAKSVGIPAIWSLDAFPARPEYRVLIGGKRFGGLSP